MSYRVVLKSGTYLDYENVDLVDSVDDITFLKSGGEVLFLAQSENVEYISNI